MTTNDEKELEVAKAALDQAKERMDELEAGNAQLMVKIEEAGRAFAVADAAPAKLRNQIEHLQSIISGQRTRIRAGTNAIESLALLDRYLATIGRQPEPNFVVQTTITLITEQMAAILRYREAIDAVLADEESKDGGWGPDVTMVAVLRVARDEGGGDEQARYDSVTVTGSGRDVTKESE